MSPSDRWPPSDRSLLTGVLPQERASELQTRWSDLICFVKCITFIRGLWCIDWNVFWMILPKYLHCHWEKSSLGKMYLTCTLSHLLTWKGWFMTCTATRQAGGNQDALVSGQVQENVGFWFHFDSNPSLWSPGGPVGDLTGKFYLLKLSYYILEGNKHSLINLIL